MNIDIQLIISPIIITIFYGALLAEKSNNNLTNTDYMKFDRIFHAESGRWE